jgi:ATP-dependent Lon protease
MEVIRISGYTEDEKINIATRYLVPKQIRYNGLKSDEIRIGKSVLYDIVRHYTREAGVRSLEREISKICRKVARELLLDSSKDRVAVNRRNLEKYLGVKQYRYGKAEELNRVGQVTGLAWTEVGGDLLTIEAVVIDGKGKQIYTGKLGDVMQESIQTAVSVIRSRSRTYDVNPSFYQDRDIHIHVPEGATPKDGPSAGTAMCTALLSALTNVPVRADVAMTGEITLRGEVLPIGGLKEKLLAAHRGGIKTVIYPKENQKDLTEIPANVLEGLELKAVQWIDEVFEIALEHVPSAGDVESEKTAEPATVADNINNDTVRAH